jgi:uncharacterized protein VirK/YbjX
LRIWHKLLCDTRKHDPFYFIVHRHHLSKHLTLRQRIESAITHHEYESNSYRASYEHKIYRADGIRLWDRKIGNHYFCVTLTGSESNRNEGELNVVLSCDGKNLWRISFSYVCGQIFLLTPDVFLLVTRNQAETSDKRTFYKCFGQNQPQMFCLSAVCGVALANGWPHILAISHENQIAYDESRDPGFNNSYTSLWKQFGARKLDDHVYEMAAPLKVRPLSAISRSHRARARKRREIWADITGSARANLSSYRLAESGDAPLASEKRSSEAV